MDYVYKIASRALRIGRLTAEPPKMDSILMTALLVVVVVMVYVESVALNCGHAYQKVLQNLESLQGSCDQAAFKDCCQVLPMCMTVV